METPLPDTAPERIAALLVEIARVHHWCGLYAPGHPFLAGRIRALRDALAEQASREPSGILLLGIVKDRALYRDGFIGGGQPLISSFTETLYRLHVATLGIGADVTVDGMSDFFGRLRALRSASSDDSREGSVFREGNRGIHLSQVNYREVLSRGVIAAGEAPSSASREDALWRLLLSSNIADEDDEMKIVEELAEFPELLPVIVRRAYEGVGADVPPPVAGTPPAYVSPDVLRRMFRRLGQTLKAMPEDRRRKILRFLEDGVDEPPAAAAVAADFPFPIAGSLVEGYSDAEFLELFASLLSLEENRGKRLLGIFRVIAAGRDVPGSLLPMVRAWSEESLRAKNYYAVKTWETIEQLLQGGDRGPGDGEAHAALLQRLPAARAKEPAAGFTENRADAAAFGAMTVARKGVVVLLELLLSEKRDPDFLVLLSAITGAIPRLIHENDFETLERALSALTIASEAGSPERRAAAAGALAGVDFHRIIEACLSDPVNLRKGKGGVELLVKFGAASADALLDRLLVEEGAARRKALLSLVVRLGEAAVAPILARLSHPRWFYVRNLCLLLGEIGDPAGVPALVRMLSRAEMKIRREAVQSLGKLRTHDPDAVSALGKVLLSESLFSSREETIRIDAASALFRIGGAEATSFLHRGRSSRREAVRNHCGALLGTRGTA
ncbi:MAG: HEAT repeat domain-containing protein [Deltaproteobacteria bacterium]|nr:MAG: HEAT repeat domain-containing protein [Deltaproteobacteria bacterium]